MPNPESPLPTDFVEKLGGRMDSLSCATPPAKLDANGQPRPLPRINADWLPFAPGSRFPLPEPGLQPLPSDEDWTPGDHAWPRVAQVGWIESAADRRVWLRAPPQICGLAVSPDGRLIAVSNRRITNLFDFVSGRLIRTWLTEGFFGDVTFSPDGTLIFAGSQAYYVASGRPCNHRGLDRAASIGAFSLDGKWVAYGGSMRVIVVATATGDAVANIDGGLGVAQSIDFSRDGRFLLAIHISGENISNISVIDVATWQLETNFDLERPRRGRFSADGNHIVLAGWNEVFIMDWRTQALVREFETAATPVFALASDRRSILVSDSTNDGHLHWLDLETGANLRSWPAKAEEFVRVIAISPDSRFAFSDAGGGRVRVWDLKRGDELIPSEPPIL